MDKVPSLREWLREQRTSHGLSLRQLATLAGVPFSTLAGAEAGTIRRPKMSTLSNVARALGVPPLAAVLVAGYADRDVADKVIDAAFFAPAHWWASLGGKYLRAVREEQGVADEVAAATWSQRWCELQVDQWREMEHTGQCPEGWPARHLSELPGAWLWGLLTTVASELDLKDLVGMAAVMGRVSRRLAVRCGAQSAIDQLATAYRAAHQGSWLRPEAFAMERFRTEVKALQVQDLGLSDTSTTSGAAPSPPPNSSRHPVPTQDPLFQVLATYWPKLTPQQREALVAVLRSWGIE